MGRPLYLGLVALLGISFVMATFFLYHGYKKIRVNGKRYLDEPVTGNTKRDRMSIGELIVYVLMFLVAMLFVVEIVYKGSMFPSASAVLIKTIILVPIMAIFNARRRTGKAVVALFASLLFLLFCTMTYMIIGLPVKAPVLTLDQTEIVLGQTTVKELMDEGFDIYLEKGQVAALALFEFPDSDEFEKYTASMDINIPKGYHRHSSEIIPKSKGFITKNNAFIAEVVFYGSMTEGEELKDCSIIYFSMQKRFASKALDNGLSVKLNGVDLLSKMEAEEMKKTFGSNIIRPDQIEEDRGLIISWSSNSEHLFFNSYAANIDMDEDFSMETFELECQIAREAD